MMDATLSKPDWHEITEEIGIDELMDHFGHFHDGCVREIHIETGHFVGEDLSMTCGWRTTVHLLVQRQRRDPSAIEMRFEEVVYIRICPPPRDWVSIIFEAAFFLHEGIFYWSEDGTWGVESLEREVPMIAARRVWWRDASEWMGSTLRYRATI